MDQEKPAYHQDDFVVDSGRISIRWPATLSEASYADVKDWFPILLRKIGRCVESETPTEGRAIGPKDAIPGEVDQRLVDLPELIKG